MWHALVPVKSWDVAKSRLDVVDADRISLARAMTVDTVAALLTSSAVRQVTVVVSDPEMLHVPDLRTADRVICQPDQRWGVNEALRWAVDDCGLGDQPVAVLLGDLPALRATSLEALLLQAETHPHVMAADRHGIGTTMLATTVGADLIPRFGPESAHRHRAAGVVHLEAAPLDVRCDVDTLDDLRVALGLGVGQATAEQLLRLQTPLPWPA